MQPEKETIHDKLERVQGIVGRITDDQHGLISQCLLEDEEGVFRFAKEAATSSFARNPAALFISGLRKGRHKTSEHSRPGQESLRPPQSWLYEKLPPEVQAERIQMAANWRRIWIECQKDPSLMEMLQEMRARCAVPTWPSHEESAAIAATMLVAIDPEAPVGR